MAKKRVKMKKHTGELVATSKFGARTAKRIQHEQDMLKANTECTTVTKSIYYDK